MQAQGPGTSEPNHLPPGFTPSEPDRLLLSWNSDFIEDRKEEGRPVVLAECQEALSSAADEIDEICDKIYQVRRRVRAKSLYLRQRLLRGEIDAPTYQAAYHALFIEQQIGLEQFLGYDALNAFVGVPPGTDPFMVLTRWGMDLPEGFKLGVEEPPPSVWGDPGDSPPSEKPLEGEDDARRTPGGER